MNDARRLTPRRARRGGVAVDHAVDAVDGDRSRGPAGPPRDGVVDRDDRSDRPADEGDPRWRSVWRRLQGWALALGFSQIAVADVNLGEAAESGLAGWLADGFHGDMRYMAAHGRRRARPAELVPGTVRVITARMNYLPLDEHGSPAPATPATPASAADWRAVEWGRLADPAQATVSVYARGRDYHKVMRGRLQTLADRLAAVVGPFGHRVFTDSAPVMEVALAARSGIGWRGKHTLALHRDAGSMFFLGEIFVDLPLPTTPSLAAGDGSCGSCSACIDVCPTRAIVAPYRLDARRCISYLTIEHAGPIPLELRRPIGNRIYGCDDCQLVCPWNKFARRSVLTDFDVRAPLGGATLLTLWDWDEAVFLRRTEGSAIRRIGHERWRRNLAVALGNLLHRPANVEADVVERADAALRAAHADATPLVREHIVWALAQRHGAC